MTLIRWFLVPISAFAVFGVALLLGAAAVDGLDRLCPPELMISGACTAWWHEPAFRAIAMACAAVAAAGVVIAPARTAPAFQPQIALAFYLLGAAFAIAFTWGGSMWLELASASVSGTVALIMITRRRRHGHTVASMLR